MCFTTYLLGIFNTVIYHCVIISKITYKMIIFMILVLIEFSIYEMAWIKF